ncbi:hypothetical protein HCX48_13515 [Rhodocyclus tenuis]|uniref:Type II/III secretion system secretin-like domain-containing protein n=1 Tax=Rhodocyclus gracilis TaxID=2929842 RepID=A0ABX0WKU6_9RHOO|nr:hypothetical protein [Rhodocyclus gracilis]NJA90234.1 hypothetical protein [Rhodocyclus gracilis]
MRRYLWLFLFVSSLASAADAINLRFDSVPVSMFAKAVFGDILKKPYLLDDDVSKKTVSLNVAQVQLGGVAKVAAAALDLAGIEAVDIDGLYVLRSAQSESLVVYRLRHRSAAYARRFLRQAFPAVQIVQQSVQSATPATPTPTPTTGQGQGASAQTDSDLSDMDVSSVVVFRVPRSDREFARRLLAEIDTPSEQLYVRAAAYEVSVDGRTGSALDLTVSALGGRLGLTLSGGKLAGGSALAVHSATMDTVLGVLDTETRFSSLSRPSVRVRSGGKARFSVGQEVPTLGGVTTNNGGSTQAVVYRSAGTIFEVSPVVRDGGIELDVRQIVSGFQVTDTSALNSPTLNKRELDTTFSVQSGDVVILAGLDSEEDTRGRRALFGVPLSRTGSGVTRQTIVLLEVRSVRD